MRVRVSIRTNSYAIYLERGDDEELGERAMRVIKVREPVWFKEVYDARYRKIIVIP